MNTPNCPKCSTDQYLKITDFTRGYNEDTSIRTGQGTIPRTRRVDPVAQFFCQKCGYFNGHTVPADWEPTKDPDVSELKGQGIYFSQPGMKHERMADGSWRMTFS
jgi:hypothetical protein